MWFRCGVVVARVVAAAGFVENETFPPFVAKCYHSGFVLESVPAMTQGFPRELLFVSLFAKLTARSDFGGEVVGWANRQSAVRVSLPDKASTRSVRHANYR